MRCDVTHADDVSALIDAAVSEFGAIDIMVNNAGITRDATMRKMTEDQFDAVIAVHLKGCWNGTRLAADRMRQAGSGSIVNISSISGKVGFGRRTTRQRGRIVGRQRPRPRRLLTASASTRSSRADRTKMTEAMPRALGAGRRRSPCSAPERRRRWPVVLFLASTCQHVTGR
jgi:3-oxoacyl-[acyl-carrier protein] reductase